MNAPSRPACRCSVDTNTWRIAEPQSFNLEVPADDHQRIEKVQNYVASHINTEWIDSLTATSERSRRLSPPAFRYGKTELARKAGKRIVLPEGDEPRTVAAAICAERGIAECCVQPDGGSARRGSSGVELGKGIEIVDPVAVRETTCRVWLSCARAKARPEVIAREQLEDNVVLGT